MTYHNIKNGKKPGLHSSLDDTFLEKPLGGGGGQIDLFSPSILRDKLTQNPITKLIVNEDYHTLCSAA